EGQRNAIMSRKARRQEHGKPVALLAPEASVSDQRLGVFEQFIDLRGPHSQVLEAGPGLFQCVLEADGILLGGLAGPLRRYEYRYTRALTGLHEFHEILLRQHAHNDLLSLEG